MSGCFRIGGEAGELRDVVLSSLEGDVRLDKEIEFSAGAVTLGIARLAVRFAEDLPPEAHMGLKAVRRADVGVYALRGAAGVDRRLLMMRASEALAARGWRRTVTVLDGGDTVLVFTPEVLAPDEDMEVCVLVVDQADLVVAKARLAPEPLRVLLRHAMDAQRAAGGAPPEDGAVARAPALTPMVAAVAVKGWRAR